MADQTLTIQVKADVAQATKGLNSVKQSVSGLTGTTGQVGGSIAQIENRLNSLTGMSKWNFFKMLREDIKSAFTNVKKLSREIEKAKEDLNFHDMQTDIYASSVQLMENNVFKAKEGSELDKK